MSIKRKKFKPSHVSSRYGAPMGRPDMFPADKSAAMELDIEELTMIDGDYDTGGAYWGGWSKKYGGMYVAFGRDVAVFVRALNKDAAAAKVRRDLPNAVFKTENGGEHG